MKHITKVAIAALATICLADTAYAKKKPDLSSLELQQMQSRDVEASKPVAFSAVMTVLQDAGYRIGGADKDTGLITGTASTSSKVTWAPFVGFGRGKKTPVVSAYLEELSPSVTRVRFNFVMTSFTSNQYGSDAGEEPIVDPIVYQTAFEKVEQAIFVRKAMTASSPSLSAAPSTSPVPTATVPTSATPTPQP